MSGHEARPLVLLLCRLEKTVVGPSGSIDHLEEELRIEGILSLLRLIPLVVREEAL
jgi:hypothetical protein